MAYEGSGTWCLICDLEYFQAYPDLKSSVEYEYEKKILQPLIKIKLIHT